MIDSAIKLGELRHLFMSDVDLRATLPVRPGLPREVMRIPYGRDRVVVIGGAEPVVLKSPRGYADIIRLLDTLDGSETLDAIIGSAGHETEQEGIVLLDIVVALARAGLLEDGPGATGRSEPVPSFFGRFAGSAQDGQHRGDMIDMLADARVLCVTGGFDGDAVRRSLEDAGVGEVLSAWPMDDDETARPVTQALFVLCGNHPAIERTILAAHAAGIPHFIIRIGAAETQVGPLVLPGVSAGYDCLSLSHPAPAGQPDELRADFWAALAAHLFVLQISRLSAGYINQFVRYHEEPGAPREVVRVAMVPGSRTSSIAADPDYARDPMLRMVWQHHMTVRRPPRALMSPRAHLHHFTTANIARTRLEAPRYHGVETLALPAAKLAGPLPWDDGADPTRPLDLAALATILRTAAGYVEVDGRRRHMAPTGGGLESPMLFLFVQDVEGLPDGGYRYYAPDHRLEVLPQLQWAIARDALGTSGLRQCTVFNLCWFEKVRGKYGDFAYSIAHYDAGIVNVYAQIACRSAGIAFVEHAEVDTRVVTDALEFASFDNNYLPTAAFGIGRLIDQPGPEERPIQRLIDDTRRPRVRHVSTPVARPHDPSGLRARTRHQSVEDLLASRRSINTFAPGPLPRDLIADVIAAGANAGADMVRAGGLDVHVWPLLFRAGGTNDLPAGVYDARDVDPARWQRRREGFSAAQLLQCINQLGLATASDLVVMVADVPGAVRAFGSAGYRAALMRAGGVVSAMWLAAHAAGVASTAAGGVLEAGIAELGGCDGYRECPMLSFALGPGKNVP